MLAQTRAASSRFHAHQANAGVWKERMKNTDGIAAAADAGEHRVRQALLGLLDLRARFFTDDLVEFANHQRIGMRPQRRAQQIVRGRNVRHPIAHGLADGIFEGAASVGHAHHFRSQQPHAKDVEPLPPYVLFAHVDHALESEKGAHGCSGHTVLSRAGLGDDALLSHATGE